MISGADEAECATSHLHVKIRLRVEDLGASKKDLRIRDFMTSMLPTSH